MARKNAELLEKELAALERMKMDALKAEWKRHFQFKPPHNQREYMIRRIAYRLQERAYGVLSQTTLNKIKRMAEDGQLMLKERYLPAPGTRLVREYKGKRICVTVLENGFEFEGKSYPSLTAIASMLMGNRTSGPKFFGIRKE